LYDENAIAVGDEEKHEQDIYSMKIVNTSSYSLRAPMMYFCDL